MRELKFRAWDGEEYLNHSSLCCPSMSLGEILNGDYVIEQFTGLHDKNGKEIYEGDIIEINMGRILPERFVVEYGGHWNDAGFGFGGKRKNKQQWETEYQWDRLNEKTAEVCEIIGNIHETPELTS